MGKHGDDHEEEDSHHRRHHDHKHHHHKADDYPCEACERHCDARGYHGKYSTKWPCERIGWKNYDRCPSPATLGTTCRERFGYDVMSLNRNMHECGDDASALYTNSAPPLTREAAHMMLPMVYPAPTSDADAMTTACDNECAVRSMANACGGDHMWPTQDACCTDGAGGCCCGRKGGNRKWIPGCTTGCGPRMHMSDYSPAGFGDSVEFVGR